MDKENTAPFQLRSQTNQISVTGIMVLLSFGQLLYTSSKEMSSSSVQDPDVICFTCLQNLQTQKYNSKKIKTSLVKKSC